jgi:hypothetical protein
MGEISLRSLRSALTFIHMERRAAQVTAAVNRAITDSGVEIDTLAEATDVSSTTIRHRLANREEWTVAELVRVGGFLRIHPATFFGGTT